MWVWFVCLCHLPGRLCEPVHGTPSGRVTNETTSGLLCGGVAQLCHCPHCHSSAGHVAMVTVAVLPHGKCCRHHQRHGGEWVFIDIWTFLAQVSSDLPVSTNTISYVIISTQHAFPLVWKRWKLGKLNGEQVTRWGHCKQHLLESVHKPLFNSIGIWDAGSLDGPLVIAMVV